MPGADTGLSLRPTPACAPPSTRSSTAGVASVYAGGTEPVWSIAAGSHRVAAFYRNGALHHLVNRAIVELALLHVAVETAGRRGDVDAAWEEALRCATC